MRLRTQLQDVLKTRIQAVFPDLLQTVWDHSALVLVIEELHFSAASGPIEGEDWVREASVDGVVRIELRADNIDSHEFEPLIPDLVKNPVFVTLPGITDAPPMPDEICTKARLTLMEWRDAIRDTDVVAALRFELAGTLCKYSPDEFRGRDPFKNVGAA